MCGWGARRNAGVALDSCVRYSVSFGFIVQTPLYPHFSSERERRNQEAARRVSDYWRTKAHYMGNTMYYRRIQEHRRDNKAH